MRMWKRVELSEETPFRQWARDTYKVGSVVNPLWHPVTRHECEAMNVEADRVRPEGIGDPYNPENRGKANKDGFPDK